MRLMTQNEMKDLINVADEPCISIYVPMGVHPSLARENSIRFKNILTEVVETLDLDWGKRSVEAKEFINPFQKLLKDDAFWQNQSGGLCAFLSPGFYRYYRLPLQFEKMVHIDNHFYVKPLLPLFNADGRFYLLSLSQKEVRFFQGTRYGFKEIVLGDLPVSRGEALKFHDEEKHLNFHTRTSGNRQERNAMFHGHGTSSEDTKTNISLFLKRVDNHLRQVLEGEQVPLILAGVDFIRDIYKNVSGYSHIAEQGISGNPERYKPKELHNLAQPIAEKVFHQQIRRDAGRFENLLSRNEASNDIEEIIVRAFDGKVGVLFVPEDGHIWGEFDRESFHVNVFPVKINGDDDLLELTSEQTIIHQGSIYAVKPEEIPGGLKVAAIFRKGAAPRETRRS